MGPGPRVRPAAAALLAALHRGEAAAAAVAELEAALGGAKVWVALAWERNPRAAGARLRELRAAAGLRQGDVAAAAGLSESAVSHLEAGRRAPRPGTVAALARALGVAPADLVAPPVETCAPPEREG